MQFVWRGNRKRSAAVFLERTRERHRQSDQQEAVGCSLPGKDERGPSSVRPTGSGRLQPSWKGRERAIVSQTNRKRSAAAFLERTRGGLRQSDQQEAVGCSLPGKDERGPSSVRPTGSGRLQSSWKGRERAIVSQTNRKRSAAVFLERTRGGHRRSDRHWNCFKGNVGESSDRRGCRMRLSVRQLW